MTKTVECGSFRVSPPQSLVSTFHISYIGLSVICVCALAALLCALTALSPHAV